MRLPRLLVDLQATDQAPLDSKAPLQIGSPAGEVAGEATSHQVALLVGALGAEHLGGVLVLRCWTFPPASDRGFAVVGLPFIDDHRLVGEQCDDSVDITTSIGLE